MRGRARFVLAGVVVLGLGASTRADDGDAEKAREVTPPDGQTLPELPIGEDLDVEQIGFTPPKWFVGQRWEQTHLSEAVVDAGAGPIVTVVYQTLIMEVRTLVQGWPHEIDWTSTIWVRPEEGAEWRKENRKGAIKFVPGGHRVLSGDATTGGEVAELLGPPYFLEMKEIGLARKIGDTWKKHLGTDAFTGETSMTSKLIAVTKAAGVRIAVIEFEVTSSHPDIGVKGTCWWNLDGGFSAAQEWTRTMSAGGVKNDERRKIRTRELKD